MTSDVKWSHCFLLLKVKWRHVVNTQIIQTPKKHTFHECKKTSGWVHIAVNCLSIYLLFKFFEVWIQYEWTLQQIFFCGYRVLQLFCHNVEASHSMERSQKQPERKFCWFHRLEVKNRFPRPGPIVLHSLALYFTIICSWRLSSSK